MKQCTNDGTIDVIREAFQVLHHSDPIFKKNFRIDDEISLKTLFFCCTFNLIKKENRPSLGMWKLAEHKIDFLHSVLEFCFYALCVHSMAERQCCPKPVEFLTLLNEFLGKFEPHHYNSVQMRRLIVDFVTLNGGKNTMAYIAGEIQRNQEFCNARKKMIVQGVIQGQTKFLPPYVQEKTKLAHFNYTRLLQILWCMHGKTFCLMAEKALSRSG